MSKVDTGPRSHPSVSVVIVNYNSGAYLRNCVTSVLNSAYPKKEVIVVDNASDDDSIARLEALRSQVRIVKNQVNLGYSGGCNIGIAKSSGEYVVVMNPDTVVDSDWLEVLTNAAERYPRAGFLQPKILLMEDRRLLNSAGNMIHIAGFGVCRGIGKRDAGDFQTETEVCYASGACTIARMRAIREIGLMDTLFFAYGEDKDWGWRGLMMGWRSVYIPSSRILHEWSPTLGYSAEKFYLLELERLLSIWKNYSRRTLVLLAPVLLLVEVSVLLYAAANGWLTEKVRSYADLLRLRRVVWERRKSIQKRRVINDGMIIRRFVSEIEHPYLGSSGAVLNRLTARIFAQVRNSI